MTVNENVNFTDYVSGIRLPDCYKLTINPKNDNAITICRHDVIVKFFWRYFVSLVKFSYWSKFLVDIITGFGVVTIYFYKGLTRNSEIGNTSVWVLPNKILLNATKCQGYSFYRFWVIRGKPTGEEGKITPLPPHPD